MMSSSAARKMAPASSTGSAGAGGGLQPREAAAYGAIRAMVNDQRRGKRARHVVGRGGLRAGGAVFMRWRERAQVSRF
jgi:hypothetical protein